MSNSTNEIIITENDNGDIFYQVDGKFHRDDGPAIEWVTGYKGWFQNDKFHRLDGPAFESPDGNHTWWINGENIPCDTQEEFEQLLRLRAFW